MTYLLLPQIALPLLLGGLILLARVVLRAASAHAGKPLTVSREWLSEHETGRDGGR